MLPSRQFWALSAAEDGSAERNLDTTENIFKKMDGDQDWIRDGDLLQQRRKRNRQRYGVSYFEKFAKVDQSKAYQKYFPMLKPHRGAIKTFRKLIKADRKVMLLQRRFMRAILGQFYLVLGRTERDWTYLFQWWVYLTNKILSTKGLLVATREWKSHALWVRNTYCQLRGFNTPYPAEHPEFCSWVFENLSSCRILERLNIYIGTRSLPAGGSDVEKCAVMKTIATLVTVRDPLNEEERKDITFYSCIAGEEVKSCCTTHTFKKACSAHASLSNKSCFEKSGIEGGKFSHIIEDFHVKWLSSIDDVEIIYDLPTGTTVVAPAGVAKWRALIDDQGPKDDDADFGDNLTGWLNPSKNGCDEKRLSTLLFTWSYKTLLQGGWINIAGRATGKPFPSRLTTVGEPGGKVRVPTIAMAAHVTYLQPFQHTMTAILEKDPTLSAGLGAAAQAFQFTKRGKGVAASHDGVLLGDLEDATNWISYEVGILHSDSFMKGLGITNPYLLNAVTLVMNSLVISHDGEEYITCNGGPMGLPGAKYLLHSISKSANVCANRQTAPIPFPVLKTSRFACAGDDILKLGSFEVLTRHKSALTDTYKMKVSEAKWGIYLRGGPFCGVMVKMGGIMESVITEKNRETNFIVDSPRPRLFSPEVKPQNGDEDTNPTFGKALGFGKELTWGDPKWHAVGTALFVRNFRDFGNCLPLIALPKNFGGFGFPLPPSIIERWIGEELRLLVSNLWRRKNTRGYAAGKSAASILTKRLLYNRGDPINLDALNEHPLVELLAPYGLTLKGVEEAENISYTAEKPRFWTRCKAAKRAGYVNINSISHPVSPYWARPAKPKKGWATAPFLERLSRLRHKAPQLFEGCELVDFVEALTSEQNTLNPISCWLSKDMGILGDETLQSLNIAKSGYGCSLSLGLPNEIFFNNEEELQPSPKRARSARSMERNP